jgi:CheY-like chemotaxis protein
MAAHATPPPSTENREKRPAARLPLRILVVDDHPGAGESLGELLALDGHRVIHASDGRRGLALLAEERPDVLVCDLELPDMRGHELLSAAREADVAPRLALSMSGYAHPDEEAQALGAGFAAHFQKPLPLDALRALLAAAAGRAGRAGSR